VSLPKGVPSLSVPAVVAPLAPAFAAPSIAAPALPQAALPRLSLPSLPSAALVAAPSIDAKIPAGAPARAPLGQRLSAIGRGVEAAAGSMDKGADPRAAGQSVERLLTGEKSFESAGGPAVPAASGAPAPDREAAQRAAEAVTGLASAAEELLSSRGVRASALSGPQFTAVVREAAAAQDAAAPADAAGKAVRAAAVRVVAALMPEGPNARESLPRLVSVLQVMGQELARHDTTAAVVADADLFASQVEQSVTEAERPPPAPELAPEPVTPADPEGHAAQMLPGSVFGWRPIEHSPDHGLPALDRLIRSALSETSSPYEAGFELPGAPRREDARVFFYGEKHTDGGLIAANMRRLVEDARPGKPVTVLVEGYTGWELRGWQAIEYLVKRGLDARALQAKGVSEISVRGWDSVDRYQASKHPLLQHHMDLLELNRLAYSDARGASYYAAVAKAAWAAAKSRRELWRKAIEDRNPDLDDAVRRAADEAGASGGSVHVIAGTDHLMQSPRLDSFFGESARPRFRASLKEALAGRPYWASQPPNTLKPLRLVIMGPPASGKGTYAQRLARDYGVVHISAGDLLREYAKTHPETAEIMQRGDLVPAELVVGLVRERLRQADVQQRGFLLDGFPRRLEEARALREMMVEEGIALDAAIRLEVPEHELLRRVLARGRADDTEATFRNRMKVYRRDTLPAMREISRGTTVVRPPLAVGPGADANYRAVRRELDESRLSWWGRLKARLARWLPF
jgi:adenylate kinase